MPRRKRSSSPWPGLGWLALAALVLVGVGEAWRLSRSDTGQLALARTLGVGDRARVTRLVGKRVAAALAQAGARVDTLGEHPLEGRGPALSWRVVLPPDASFLQFNYALMHALESDRLAVLSGREAWTEQGAPMLRLVVGLPKRATHELLITRSHGGVGEIQSEPGRLALVLFGFGEDAARADSFFAAPLPFGVAVVAGDKGSTESFRAAHKRGRELVLHLPLEPLNFPQVNPGPGTLLVTMKPTKVAGEVRRYLDQAAPVAAVANDLGSLATQDMTLMRAVYHELKKGDVPFVHVSPVAGAVCKPLAADMGIGYAEPDLVLDRETRKDTRALDHAWATALDRARTRGRALVWMRATPLSLRWLKGALAPKRIEGVAVVPLSVLLRTTAP
jgi:polysaccharide deacetylase 2 family uncharacterized protein YibQ